MTMHTVKSSAITSIGYDAATRKMRVLFKAGKLYEFDGITADQHEKLRSAKSIGAHFAKHHQKHGKLVKGK